MPRLRARSKATRADSLDFVGVVDLSVDAALLAVAEIDDLFGFAEVDAARQFANDHDVEALDDFALERGRVRERGVADRRAQIGIEREFLAQPQQPGFRPQFVGNPLPFRTADRGEQDGVGALGERHVRLADGLTVSVVGAAADQALLDLEPRASLAREKRCDLLDFGHHFGSDAVAGKQEKFVGGHESPCVGGDPDS